MRHKVRLAPITIYPHEKDFTLFGRVQPILKGIGRLKRAPKGLACFVFLESLTFYIPKLVVDIKSETN